MTTTSETGEIAVRGAQRGSSRPGGKILPPPETTLAMVAALAGIPALRVLSFREDGPRLIVVTTDGRKLEVVRWTDR